MLPELSIGEGAEPSPNQRAQIAGLIRDLDSDRFAVRNAAHQRLATLGIAALPQLLAARNAGSAEVTQRVDLLIRDLAAPQVPTLSELQQRSPDSQQNLRDLDRQLEAFANNPDRTAARIRDIETIRTLLRNAGAGDLYPDALERLQSEQNILENINQSLATVRLELASQLASPDRGRPGVAEATDNQFETDQQRNARRAEVRRLLSDAMQRDATIVNDPRFMQIVVQSQLNNDRDFMSNLTGDSNFMRAYRAAGGTPDGIQQLLNNALNLEQMRRTEIPPAGEREMPARPR